VAFLKKNFKSVGISGEINVRPCHFLREPNEFIGRCYRTRLGPTFLGSYRGASAIRGVNLFFLTSLPHYLFTSIQRRNRVALLAPPMQVVHPNVQINLAARRLDANHQRFRVRAPTFLGSYRGAPAFAG